MKYLPFIGFLSVGACLILSWAQCLMASFGPEESRERAQKLMDKLLVAFYLSMALTVIAVFLA